jgi:hypothetical protein
LRNREVGLIFGGVTRSVAVIATMLVFAPSASAAGQRVSEGEKVPKGTLITGDCWERGGDQYRPPNDTANTVVYETDPSLVTVGGVYPKECKPVRVTEVGDHLATTYYYKCNPECKTSQKDVRFEVVTAGPRALWEALVQALNAHRNALDLIGKSSTRSLGACEAARWSEVEKRAAQGEDDYRERTQPAHRALVAAIDALARARRDVKRSRREKFDRAIDAWRDAARSRKRAQSNYRQALLQFGDRDCRAGANKRRTAREHWDKNVQHAKRASALTGDALK